MATTWLDQVNEFRQLANVSNVTEDASLSQADYDLCKYECETLNIPSHLDNDPTNPNYTAGQNSLLYGGIYANKPDTDIINDWGLSLFHAIRMIDPGLMRVGYGYYTTEAPTKGGLHTVAALNIGQGRDNRNPSYPVMWPADGRVIGASTYHAEIPDARQGYGLIEQNVGLPIILQLGYNKGNKVKGSV